MFAVAPLLSPKLALRAFLFYKIEKIFSKNTVVKKYDTKTGIVQNRLSCYQIVAKMLEKKIWAESKELKGGFNIFRE